MPVQNFRQDLEDLINRHNKEAESNTPDFILAEYLVNCLEAFDRAVSSRERFYGRTPQQCDAPLPPPEK